MGYSTADKLLHKLALGNNLVARASFDMELMLHKPDVDAIVNSTHVFIAGLARAGTTVLMRRYFSTKAFASLTYRDMPFVLMPNLWARLSVGSRKAGRKHERAHGDGLMVDYDSPEALEEMFWRVFAGDRYLRDDCLVPMQPDEQLVERFQSYVAAILARYRDERPLRYLSKNNNNILRLPTIHRAFPNAVLIVPFRDPVQHAWSLLGQHRRFIAEHKADPFSRQFMTWLVHHEFGSDHRPFRFSEHPPMQHPTDSLNYWLALWTATYRWLLANAPARVIFQSYEKLCTDLGREWAALAAAADVSGDLINADVIELRHRQVDEEANPQLQREAEKIYQQLNAHNGETAIRPRG